MWKAFVLSCLLVATTLTAHADRYVGGTVAPLPQTGLSVTLPGPDEWLVQPASYSTDKRGITYDAIARVGTKLLTVNVHKPVSKTCAEWAAFQAPEGMSQVAAVRD